MAFLYLRSFGWPPFTIPFSPQIYFHSLSSAICKSVLVNSVSERGLTFISVAVIKYLDRKKS